LAQLIAGHLATPTFTSEGNYSAANLLNAPYAKPGPYLTKLPPQQEIAFRAWAARNRVPVTPDYDMRAYFLATKGAPHAAGTHFPDTYKTPLDTTFSNESIYAKPTAPVWQGDRLVNQQTQQTVFADQAAPPSQKQIQAALDALRNIMGKAA
jgi:hypothetical protein